jgi:hypothetical protein
MRNHARGTHLALPPSALVISERQREAGEGFHVGARDAVLLADAHGFQTAVAHVIADRFDVQLEALRDLEDREQFLGLVHGSSPFVMPGGQEANSNSLLLFINREYREV